VVSEKIVIEGIKRTTQEGINKKEGRDESN
jgi:hypothetical protein